MAHESSGQNFRSGSHGGDGVRGPLSRITSAAPALTAPPRYAIFFQRAVHPPLRAQWGQPTTSPVQAERWPHNISRSAARCQKTPQT